MHVNSIAHYISLLSCEVLHQPQAPKPGEEEQEELEDVIREVSGVSG